MHRGANLAGLHPVGDNTGFRNQRPNSQESDDGAQIPWLAEIRSKVSAGFDLDLHNRLDGPILIGPRGPAVDGL